MGSYRISEDAAIDLARIWREGCLRWGETQADKYYWALMERFELIAAQPLLYQAVDHIRSGYRRSVCGVDSIFYRVESDMVEIMAIIGRQDFEEEVD